jgi:hypothetical protein
VSQDVARCEAYLLSARAAFELKKYSDALHYIGFVYLRDPKKVQGFANIEIQIKMAAYSDWCNQAAKSLKVGDLWNAGHQLANAFEQVPSRTKTGFQAASCLLYAGDYLDAWLVLNDLSTHGSDTNKARATLMLNKLEEVRGSHAKTDFNDGLIIGLNCSRRAADKARQLAGQGQRILSSALTPDGSGYVFVTNRTVAYDRIDQGLANRINAHRIDKKVINAVTIAPDGGYALIYAIQPWTVQMFRVICRTI